MLALVGFHWSFVGFNYSNTRNMSVHRSQLSQRHCNQFFEILVIIFRYFVALWWLFVSCSKKQPESTVSQQLYQIKLINTWTLNGHKLELVRSIVPKVTTIRRDVCWQHIWIMLFLLWDRHTVTYYADTANRTAKLHLFVWLCNHIAAKKACEALTVV